MYLLVTFLLALGVFTWWASRRRPANSLPFPPGPPEDPLIGHLRIIPLEHTHNWFYELSKTYGKVASLRVPGQTIIVLNSAKAAIDLLDKRSAIYSDRPISTMMRTMGWLNTLVFTPYGKDFVKHRKLFNEFFNPTKARTYRSHQALEARRFVHGLYTKPQDFITQVNRFAAGNIVRIIQGHEILSNEDPYVKLLEDTNYCIANCSIPFNNPLDLFPVLRKFPSWFPGTFTATQARGFRPQVEKIHDIPINHVKRQMADGTALDDSFMFYHLEGLNREGDEYPYTVDDITGAAGVSYTAGSDTTFSTLLIFILAMVFNPEAQAKAQEELDRVLGGDRLPQFEDRENLPYMEALLQETFRWHNAVPLGVPHKSTEDDVYEGMFIPKGSLVIACTRGISLDEDVYKDPHTFDPSRYERGEPFLASHYGFGRRICPGKHLADVGVWIAAASLLSAFTISPERDQQGNPIMPKVDFVAAVTCHPKAYKCTITPRNKLAQLALQTE